MTTRNRAKILITTDELAVLLGYPGGRIFQAKLDSDSFDDCVVITMEHDSLPEVRQGEVLQNISWLSRHYSDGIEGEVVTTGIA